MSKELQDQIDGLAQLVAGISNDAEKLSNLQFKAASRLEQRLRGLEVSIGMFMANHMKTIRRLTALMDARGIDVSELIEEMKADFDKIVEVVNKIEPITPLGPTPKNAMELFKEAMGDDLRMKPLDDDSLDEDESDDWWRRDRAQKTMMKLSDTLCEEPMHVIRGIEYDLLGADTDESCEHGLAMVGDGVVMCGKRATLKLSMHTTHKALRSIDAYLCDTCYMKTRHRGEPTIRTLRKRLQK